MYLEPSFAIITLCCSFSLHGLISHPEFKQFSRTRDVTNEFVRRLKMTPTFLRADILI